MKILAAQINPTIGDLSGNTQLIINGIMRGQRQKADLVLFPELSLSGYPPEDFILLPHFMESIACHLKKIIEATQDIAVIVGLPRYNPHKFEKILYNSAALIQNGQLIDFADKILLPTYDVFDERRYFEPGIEAKTWQLKGENIAVTICEDIWQHSGLLQCTQYKRDPILELKEKKPTLLLNLSASPYSTAKFERRVQVCQKAARTLSCPVILCNQVGGNDSLIFDGYSLFVNKEGLAKLAKGFSEDDLFINLSDHHYPLKLERNPIQDLYQALLLGLKDYFFKLGCKKACLGLSGGIDSALVACLAAEALGPKKVLGVAMPSRYSSQESLRDASLLAERLGIEFLEVPIESPFDCFLSLLAPHFEGLPEDHTEENLQARIRGMILMAFSNKFGHLLLSTGNKSEMAVGYSTLYGDMCGGLAVIGDATKEQVYALSKWINREREIIPFYTIERAPSAELRPNQKDSDSLPDYSIIDTVLSLYLEEHRSPHWISEHTHHPLATVQDIVNRIHRNEFKRQQAPPVLRISEKAFSVGRHFPIIQKWINC